MDQVQPDTWLAIALAFAAFMFVRFLPRIQAKMMGVPFIDTEDARRLVDGEEDVLVLDVRTPGEFTGDLGHISGAVNLDVMKLGQKLGELGDALEPYKNQPILITCRTHNRSPRAAKVLSRQGFQKLMILDGGMAGWNRLGYPTTKS